MRDEFSKPTKEILAKRVSYKCSNPGCKRATVGPHTKPEKAINLGVAAHISAASKGGPRYSENISSEERRSIKNGIWLCQFCAKLIDSDTIKYSTKELINWKSIAENESLSVISNDLTINNNSTFFHNQIKVHESLHYEIKKLDSLITDLIKNRGMSIKEKKDAAVYLSQQLAKFTEDNSLYLKDEISVQCVGTFMEIDDIFHNVKGIDKTKLKNYKRSIKRTQKLLKSLHSKGLISTASINAMMSHYNKSELRKLNDD